VALYALAGRRDRELLGAVLRLAPWTLLGAILILVAGFMDDARVWLWIAALVWTHVGATQSGSTGLRMHPSHFAERYGLVLIIALGEAFISMGIGATWIGIGPGEVVAGSSGSSSPPHSGWPTSTSSRSEASGCCTIATARNASRSPATCTRTRISR
jgi:hypothetical protein